MLDAAIRLCDELTWVGAATAARAVVDALEPLPESTLPETLARLMTAKAAMLNSLGSYSEALGLAEETRLQHPELMERREDIALKLQVIEGTSLWLLNRPREALVRLRRARERLLTMPDSALLAECTAHMSASQWLEGDYGAAKQLALDALVSARRSGSKFAEGIALGSYALLARGCGRWAEAQESTEEAMKIHESYGNQRQLNYARRGLAIIHWRRGRLEEALRLCDICLANDTDAQNPTAVTFARLVKAAAYIHKGEWAKARDLCRTVTERVGLACESRAAVIAMEYIGDADLEQGKCEEAAAQFQAAYPLALAMTPEGDLVADLGRRLAECSYLKQRHGEAYSEVRASIEHSSRVGDRNEHAACHRVLALSAAALGKTDEAKKWFDEGFAIYEELQTPYEWGKLWLAYGDWLSGPHAGAYADRRGALEAYYAARNHFEGMGAEAKLAEVKDRIEKLVRPEGDGVADRAADAEPAATRHAPRRPRRSTEMDRCAAWAFETFKIVTRNSGMLALLDDVAKLAASQTPMLVLGESGTGKELIARGIHALSLRKGTFMAINAGSLPREIIESELFGHVAGSFTGASRDKVGMFEVCDKGTVFLDEIGEMPVELQSRLLRFLETGESRRVGSNGHVAVDTRIIAATNRDRSALERGDGFRLDLYYRLAHAVIVLPPLRQRGDDIGLLLEHFLREACAAAGREVRFSPAAARRLTAYSWPGNVRQLRAVIKRVVLLSHDGQEVTPDKLQLENAEVPTTLVEELEQAERRRVEEALAQARGSHTEAARILGMPRTTLINRAKRFGLT